MKLDHIALWTTQIEVLSDFYVTYSGGIADELYIDPQGDVSCRYILFPEGSKLEIMQANNIHERHNKITDRIVGLTHLAFDAKSKQRVDTLTETLRKNGYQIEKPATMITENFYESAIFDPDGNIIEINCTL